VDLEIEERSSLDVESNRLRSIRGERIVGVVLACASRRSEEVSVVLARAQGLEDRGPRVKS